MSEAEPKMRHAGQTLEEALPSSGETPVQSRRNLPRASQACQMCRLKKARCNQQQPCSHCIRHSFTCVFAERIHGRRRSTASVGVERRRKDFGQGDGAEKQDCQRTPPIAKSIEEHRGEGDGHAPEVPILRLQAAEDSGASGTPAGENERSEDNRNYQYGEISASKLTPAVEEGLPEPDSDIVGDINKHTSGTEFYGTSSNFVLLNQLFSHARLQASNTSFEGSSSYGKSPVSGSTIFSGNQDGKSTENSPGSKSGPKSKTIAGTPLSHLADNRLSIVNLLYNDEDMNPPSRPKTPTLANKNGQFSATVSGNSESSSRLGPDRSESTQPNSVPSSKGNRKEIGQSGQMRHGRGRTRLTDQVRKPVHPAERRLEKEYVRLFFNNLHHLHPLLYVPEFMSRCEEEIWNTNSSAEPRRDRMHFLALYHIVVAVGALIAGPEILQGFERELGILPGADEKTRSARTRSSLTLSKTYFQKSRTLLGDIFEVCSLESAQTLFLTSLYCQNALKPHSCYMYSGMAVRTALAIGLPSESMSRSSAARKAARRTWWCIYSHEIDMCCSSGRRDSLMKPGNYLIPLPQIRDQSLETPEIEEHNISMINEMVHFSVILRRASKQIYHDAKGLTLLEKSAIAVELDALLETWRSSLPSWLNLDIKSFREPEWASKQKLVLQLRYLNARILLHRPFLADSASTDFGQLERNVDACLDAARKTIDLMYEAYAHRHYFRTWWYNSTYTLYAGMIVLYIILLNYTNVPGHELLSDVEKSREILLAMEEASVAQRSAKLMGEVLEVAKTYISQRQDSTNLHQSQYKPLLGSDVREGPTEPNYDTMMMDSDWSRALFAPHLPGSSRGDILATLIDPTILQDFAAGNNFPAANDISPSALSAPYYGSPEQGERGTPGMSGMPWGMSWDTFGDPLSMQGGIW